MIDPLWLRFTLGVHIGAGATAFITAPVAMLTAKGGKTHRKWGKVYFWALTVITVSALIMAIYRPILFLALVAVFSFYAAFLAYRILYLKDLYRHGKADAADWVAALITFFTSLLLSIFGVYRPAWVQQMRVVSVIFGILGMRLAAESMYQFIRPPKDKMFWWYRHMGGMLGSYIAAWTAFSAVTLTRFLGSAWYVWLWPTLIGGPGIFIWQAYYRRKFIQRYKINVARDTGINPAL